MHRFLLPIRSLDRWLLLAVVFLSVMGLLNLAGMPSQSALLVKQTGFIVFGLLVIAAVASFDYRLFRSTPLPGMAIWGLGIAMLVAAIADATTVRGAANWLFVGPLSIGPIEVVKLGTLLTLAHFLAREHRRLVFPKRLAVSAVFVAVPVLLTFLQPDFGAAVVLGALWFFLVLLLGIPLRMVASIVIMLTLIAGALWSEILRDYQKERFLAFLDPTHDPFGAGYQAGQALTTIGSAGVWGRGFFATNLQSRLAFLPESATDFAFAALVEKSGLLGALFMLAAFALLFLRIARAGRNVTNNFSFAYALGLLVLLATEAALNIGMNLRLLPVTGQPLPFVSYGGSHLLIKFFAIGLLESVRLHQPEFLSRRDLEEEYSALEADIGNSDALVSAA